MKIQLKHIKIINFKGIREREFNFEMITPIYGDNGTGKTTLMDAFVWCLFGKDSTGAKDFNIKTLDENNVAIPRIEHSVKLILDVDTHPVTVERIFKEKWVKKKGQNDLEFKGHETTFFWNEVPVKANEFKAKIDSLVREDLFKMITSTTAFNSLPWKDRRSLLVEMAGNISDVDVSNLDESFSRLLEKLDGTKSVDEYKRELAAKRKLINDELKAFPLRIDEVERGKPDPVDGEKLNADLVEVEKLIAKANNEIADESKSHESLLSERKAKQDDIYKLKGERSKLESDYNIENSSAKTKSNSVLTSLQNELKQLNVRYDSNKESRFPLLHTVEQLSEKLAQFRIEWDSIQAEEFKIDESKLECPSCKRPVDDFESKKDQMKIDFNTSKTTRLNALNKSGQDFKKMEESAKLKLSNHDESMKALKDGIDAMDVKLKSFDAKPFEPLPVPQRIAEITNEIEKLDKEVQEIQPKTNESLGNILNGHRETRDGIKKQLATSEQIEKANTRIKELKDEESKLGEELSGIEKDEQICEKFTMSKIELVENRINSMFVFCKFKMFNNLINGGFEETCEAMVNGVPFSDMNHASRINAGLDIINTLTRHYDITAPVFVDNAEAVNELLPTESQLITLHVSTDKLKIKS